MSPIFLSCYRFDPIKLAGIEDMNNITDELPDQTTDCLLAAPERLKLRKTESPVFLGCFYPFLIMLAGNKEMHRMMGES